MMAESQATVALKKLEDQLTCAICLDTYKDPKLLHCFHVYCKDCLQRLVVQAPGSEQPGQGLSLRCPTCRQPTLLPQATGVSGLPPAFHIENLFEIQQAFERMKVSRNVQCEKCTKSTRQATSFCRDCGQFICEMCCDIHNEWEEFSKHEVVSMKQVQSTTKELAQPKLAGRTLYCSQHKGKELELYCETCEELICLNCTVKKHKDHLYDLVEDTFEKHKAEITTSLEPLDGRLSTVNTVLEQLDEQSKGLDDQQASVEASIQQQVQELHEMLNARKAELLEQLHQQTEAKLKNLAAQRSELEAVHSQLSSCVTFVKDSLRTGSEEEVMKMKPVVMKQIKEITDPDKMPPLEPCESADMKFTTSPELLLACQQVGEVYLNEVAPWRCYAEGEGLKVAVPGERATATVHIVTSEGNAHAAPVKTLVCELVSEITGEKIKCIVKQTEVVSQYKISYQPTARGRHQLHIKVVGEHIQGSPFTVYVKLPVQKLGTPVNTITAVKRPWGVATSRRGDVIVADYRGHCVCVFSSTGEKVRSVSSFGAGLRPIHSPRGVALDSDNNILVVDGSHGVRKFTLSGEFIKAVGREGSNPLEFNCPTGIAVHPHTAKVYVADTDNHRIQILNSDLTFSGEFGGSAKLPLKSPWGVAFDSTGNVYIADSRNHCIQVFSEVGLFLRRFGREGEYEGKLSFPTCISIDGDNLVYISEYGNHRVSVFTCEGEFLTSFGSMGSGPGQFNEPRGITVDRNGCILVSDCENKCIQFF